MRMILADMNLHSRVIRRGGLLMTIHGVEATGWLLLIWFGFSFDFHIEREWLKLNRQGRLNAVDNNIHLSVLWWSDRNVMTIWCIIVLFLFTAAGQHRRYNPWTNRFVYHHPVQTNLCNNLLAIMISLWWGTHVQWLAGRNCPLMFGFLSLGDGS